MIFWMICKTCIKYGTMVNIARAHLLLHKIVHVLGLFVNPISVYVTKNSEHWATDAVYVIVYYDATIFTTNVGLRFNCNTFWIKNLNIIFVKRSKNKTVLCLAHFSFLNHVVIDNSRVCVSGF